MRPTSMRSTFARTRRPPIGHIRNVRFEHIKAVAGDGGIRRSKSGWEAPWKRPYSAVASGPDGHIENISFSDVDLTFPGGGTAEHAARLDVGERFRIHRDEVGV